MRQLTCHLPEDVYEYLVNKSFQANKQIGWIIAAYVEQEKANKTPPKPKKQGKNNL